MKPFSLFFDICHPTVRAADWLRLAALGSPAADAIVSPLDIRQTQGRSQGGAWLETLDRSS